MAVAARAYRATLDSDTPGDCVAGNRTHGAGAAGVWGNEAIDQKLHDIGTSGPVVLEPDYSKFKVVGLTADVAQSYAPVNITVSYAGQDGMPKPFLLLINWIKIGKDWKIASEIILPVPPERSDLSKELES
jgi:hypothetical protein